MKAYEIIGTDANKPAVVVAAETEEEARGMFTGEIEEIEEICELFAGCDGTDIPYYVEGEDEIFFGDFILERGTVMGDTTHSGEGEFMGDIDIARTNELSKKDGCNPFHQWEFNLWVGSFWNGSNWRVITIERY